MLESNDVVNKDLMDNKVTVHVNMFGTFVEDRISHNLNHICIVMQEHSCQFNSVPPRIG